MMVPVISAPVSVETAPKMLPSENCWMARWISAVAPNGVGGIEVLPQAGDHPAARVGHRFQVADLIDQQLPQNRGRIRQPISAQGAGILDGLREHLRPQLDRVGQRGEVDGRRRDGGRGGDAGDGEVCPGGVHR
jgi:hypothetical protein